MRIMQHLSLVMSLVLPSTACAGTFQEAPFEWHSDMSSTFASSPRRTHGNEMGMVATVPVLADYTGFSSGVNEAMQCATAKMNAYSASGATCPMDRATCSCSQLGGGIVACTATLPCGIGSSSPTASSVPADTGMSTAAEVFLIIGGIIIVGGTVAVAVMCAEGMCTSS